MTTITEAAVEAAGCVRQHKVHRGSPNSTTLPGDASRLSPATEPPAGVSGLPAALWVLLARVASCCSLLLNHSCTFARADRLRELDVGHGSGRDGVLPYFALRQLVGAHCDGEAEAITCGQ